MSMSMYKCGCHGSALSDLPENWMGGVQELTATSCCLSVVYHCVHTEVTLSSTIPGQCQSVAKVLEPGHSYPHGIPHKYSLPESSVAWSTLPQQPGALSVPPSSFLSPSTGVLSAFTGPVLGSPHVLLLPLLSQTQQSWRGRNTKSKTLGQDLCFVREERRRLKSSIGGQAGELSRKPCDQERDNKFQEGELQLDSIERIYFMRMLSAIF